MSLFFALKAAPIADNSFLFTPSSERRTPSCIFRRDCFREVQHSHFEHPVCLTWWALENWQQHLRFPLFSWPLARLFWWCSPFFFLISLETNFRRMRSVWCNTLSEHCVRDSSFSAVSSSSVLKGRRDASSIISRTNRTALEMNTCFVSITACFTPTGKWCLQWFQSVQEVRVMRLLYSLRIFFCLANSQETASPVWWFSWINCDWEFLPKVFCRWVFKFLRHVSDDRIWNRCRSHAVPFQCNFQWARHENLCETDFVWNTHDKSGDTNRATLDASIPTKII